MSFELAIQTGVYNALIGDSGVMALVTGVYDSVPQTEVFPYITIGEDTHTGWTTNTTLGMDSQVVVNVWSRDRGRKETKLIQAQIYDALNRANLTYSGYDIINIELLDSTSFLDADGLTRHGVQTFRALIERN